MRVSAICLALLACGCLKAEEAYEVKIGGWVDQMISANKAVQDFKSEKEFYFHDVRQPTTVYFTARTNPSKFCDYSVEGAPKVHSYTVGNSSHYDWYAVNLATGSVKTVKFIRQLKEIDEKPDEWAAVQIPSPTPLYINTIPPMSAHSKTNTGITLAVNNNDSDGDGIIDLVDSEVFGKDPDMRRIIANHPWRLPITITSSTNGVVAIYETQNKRYGNKLTGNSISYNGTDDGKFYVEGIGPGTTTLTMTAPGGFSDSIKIDVLKTDLDIRETVQTENRVCLDDTRTQANARDRILIWANTGANTVTFDLIKPPDITSPVWIQIEDQNGLNLGLPHFERLDASSGTFTYAVAQENDDADLIVRHGADLDGDGILSGIGEIEGSYEVYGVTATEYAESRSNYLLYFALLHDMADQLHKRFRNGAFATPVWPQGDFRPTSTTGSATLSADRFTHNFGDNFTATGFVDIAGRKYFDATVTLPIYFYDNNSTSSELIRENDEFQVGLNAFINGLHYATVSNAYVAVGGGVTRSITLSLDGAQFEFGAIGWIGLGGVSVNSANPYSSSGTVTLEITKSGSIYEIAADAIVDLTLHDVFDFNYFNQSWAANHSDASRSAGMIQSGFGKTGSTANAGQVGLVEVEIDGTVETNGRTITP